MFAKPLLSNLTIIVISKVTGVQSEYEIPDVLWERIIPLLPSTERRKSVVLEWMTEGLSMSAILYVLRTGCQWNALPRSLIGPNQVQNIVYWWMAKEYRLV